MRKVLLVLAVLAALSACAPKKPVVLMPQFEPMVAVNFLNVTDASGAKYICLTPEQAVFLKQHEEQWILKESAYRALLKQMGAVDKSPQAGAVAPP